MISRILFIVTCLLLVNCASVNECINNMQVNNEFAAQVRTGGWKARIHIEPLEDGSSFVSTEMQKMYSVAPEQIDYMHNSGFLDKDGREFVVTRLVFSSKKIIIRYIRQIISFDPNTKRVKWNDVCLDRTVIKK